MPPRDRRRPPVRADRVGGGRRRKFNRATSNGMGAIVVIERACEKACSAPVSSPLAAARLPRQRARASSAEPGPPWGTAESNSSRARSASPRRPRPTRASTSNALQLSTPGRPPTLGGPVARTGSAASITPRPVATGEGQRRARHGGSSGGQRSREALSRRPRRSCVRIGVGPLPAEGENLGGTGVGPSEINRAVGVHGQRGRQLCSTSPRRPSRRGGSARR